MSASTVFRYLNSNEITAINSAAVKGKIPESHPLLNPTIDALVSYENMQGGFCVCVIVIPMDGTLSRSSTPLVLRGASRRSYKDPRKPVRGEMLAFTRALLYSRPVELNT
jgi:hypothetical protein